MQAALDALLRELLGPRVRATVERRWSGIMGFTPDGLPLAGRHPARERLYLLAGLNGHGMGWAPGLAQALTEELLGQGAGVAPCLAPVTT